MAQQVVERCQISIRLVCSAFGISETCYRYQPKLSDENAEIADWLPQADLPDLLRTGAEPTDKAQTPNQAGKAGASGRAGCTQRHLVHGFYA